MKKKKKKGEKKKKVVVEKIVKVMLQAEGQACEGVEFPIKVQVEGTPHSVRFYEPQWYGVQKEYDIVDEKVEVVPQKESTCYIAEAKGQYCPSFKDTSWVIAEMKVPFELIAPDTVYLCKFNLGIEVTTSSFSTPLFIDGLLWEYAKYGTDSFIKLREGVSSLVLFPIDFDREPTTGVYTFRLTVQSMNGCFREEKEKDIFVENGYQTEILEEDRHITICEGDEITLRLNPDDPYYKYEWIAIDMTDTSKTFLSNQSVVTVQPTNNTRYYVFGKGKKCEDGYFYYVDVVKRMKIETEIIDNRSIALQVSGGYGSYQYDFGEGFGTSNVIEDFDYIRYYQVKVRDEFGCEVDTVIKMREVELRFPEFFTPQSDGVNDVWLVENLNYYKGVTVRIYDRMGKLLFETKNPDEGWNGEYLGHAMPSTDYWYEVYVKDIKEVYSGHFTLIRK